MNYGRQIIFLLIDMYINMALHTSKICTKVIF